MNTNKKQSELDAFFADWCERMERLREAEMARCELERWEPEGAAN